MRRWPSRFVSSGMPARGNSRAGAAFARHVPARERQNRSLRGRIRCRPAAAAVANTACPVARGPLPFPARWRAERAPRGATLCQRHEPCSRLGEAEAGDVRGRGRECRHRRARAHDPPEAPPAVDTWGEVVVNRRARMGGLTLLELLIAVAVVGILLSSAYPSYSSYSKR